MIEISKKNKIIELMIDILFLIPFVYLPNYILTGILDPAFEIYSIIIFCLIVFLYIKKNGFSISKILIIILLLYLIPFVSTLILKNYSMLKFATRMLLGGICLTLLIDYNVTHRQKDFLKSVIIFLGVLVVLNVMSFFVFYPSMDPSQRYFYFLGNDNGSIYETFAFIYISLLYYDMYRKKIPYYFYVIVAFLAGGYFYVKSGNGMACMLISIIFLLTYKTKLVKKFSTLKFLIPVYIVFFAFVVGFGGNVSVIQSFLKLIGKSPTISGRTIIWSKSINYILKYPLLGNGYEGQVLTITKIGNAKVHNIILQYLYTGGMAMLGMFISLVTISLIKIRNSKIKDSTRTIMLFSIFLFFVISIFDFYISKFITLLVLLIYYYIVVNKGEKNES